MVEIKARIKLYKTSEGGRKNPVISGYFPLFSFIKEMRVGGRIDLINKEKLLPGEEGIANVRFVVEKYFGDDFRVGRKVFISEPDRVIGEAEILEIFSDDSKSQK